MGTDIARFLALCYGTPPGGYAPPPGPPMYQPPGPPMPPPQQVSISLKLDRAVILPLITALVAVVLLIVACVTPWYSVSSKSSGSFSGYSFSSENTWTLDSQGSTAYSKSTNSVTGTTSKTETKSWTQYTEDYKKYNDGATPKVPGLYTMTLALSLGALALGAAAVAMLLWRRFPKVVSVLMIAAGVLGLVAIAALAGLQPQYMRDDAHRTTIPSDGPESGFMGSNTTSSGGATGTYSWGPGTGWYCALAGSVVMFVAAAMLFLRKPKQQPAYPAPSPYQQQPPAGYGPPGYQQPPPPPMQQGYSPPPFQPQPGGAGAPPQYGPGPSMYAPPPVPPQQPPYGQPPGPPYNPPPAQ